MSPRRASPFLSLRRKKGTKERATLLAVTPPLRAGATCDARSRGAQTLSQTPQLFGSLVVSMQAVPHWVVPPLQTTPQFPCEQTSPTAQTLSHAPQ